MRSSLLTPDAAREVIAALRSAVPGIAFAVERLGSGFAHEPAYVPRWDSADPKAVGEVEELLADGLVKLLARHEELDSDTLLGGGPRGRRRGRDADPLGQRWAAGDQRSRG